MKLHENCNICLCLKCANAQCKLQLYDIRNNGTCVYCVDLDGSIAEETSEKSQALCNGYKPELASN